jgi:hypothetical protein
MTAKFLSIVIIVATCTGCSQKNDPDDEDLKAFLIENVDSRYDLGFKFPKSIVSIKNLKNFDQLDTMDRELNWIFGVQYENPDLNCFYDSLNTSVNIIIKAGPRVDISKKPRSNSYFAVPTTSLDEVFPMESDSVKVVYDSGKKTYGDKTYFKRRYKRVHRKERATTYFFISSKWHSALVVVNSPEEMNMDKYVLSFLAHAKRQSSVQ